MVLAYRVISGKIHKIMESIMKNKLIVTLSRKTASSDYKGSVKPLVQFNNSGFELVDPDDFPNNGEIFFPKDYNIIEDKYDYEELFILEDYDENIYYDKFEPNIAQYISYSSNTSPLPANLMCPIISTKLPSACEPYLSLDMMLNIPKRDFFIEDNDFVYGPFRADIIDQKYLIYRTPTRINSLDTEFIARVALEKLKDYFIYFKDETQYNKYLFNYDSFISNITEENKIDFIPDEKLIKWARNYFQKSTKLKLTKKDANDLTNTLSELSEKENSVIQNRSERINTLINKIIDSSILTKSLIESYFETDTGKNFLESFVKDHKDTLVQNELEVFQKEIDMKKTDLEKSITDLKQQQKQYKEEVDTLKQDIDEKLKRENEELINQQKELNKSIDFLKQEKENIIEGMKNITDIKNLKETRDSLQDEVYRTRRDIDLLEEKYKSIANSGTTDLKNKLTEISAYIQLLNGTMSIKKNPAPSKEKHTAIKEFKGTINDYIKEIADNLESSGRNFSYDEVANILLSIHLHFLVILSGPPGVGKTSLINYLSKSMGNYNNLCSIATSRGWTSQKDLLGFFNPLKSEFQAARTGLYEFLTKRNTNSDNSNFYNWVLLDEANLSPMEHYWADFLLMCDFDNRQDQYINISGTNDENKIEICENLRFIATINNDHTTEKLSPRLIDRAPIISLAPVGSINELDNSLSKFEYEDCSISYNNINELFKNAQRPLSSKAERILNEVHEALISNEFETSNAISISIRKLKNLSNYCSYAESIFEDESSALDFAVSQMILPTIEGYGASFGKRLELIGSILNKNYLSRSFKQIEAIISHGKATHHSYSYFY